MGKRANIRLKKRWEFQRVYNNGRKVSLDHLSVFVYDNADRITDSFLGVTVTKKIGNAVIRNKTKRRVVEIYFSIIDQIKPGFDLVIMPKPNVKQIMFRQMAQEIKKGLSLLGILSEENTVRIGDSDNQRV